MTANACEYSSGGTKVGATKPLDGNGQATSDASTDTSAVGTYCWRAEYSGDGFYIPSSHTNATPKSSPFPYTTLFRSTTSSPTGGNVVPGSSASDTATVSGGAGQPTPTGTVDFFLCQPATVTSNGGDCSSGGTKVGATKPLDGNGQATSDASTNTSAVGTYCWRAEYSGDGFYLPSSHTNATTECFSRVDRPAIAIEKAPDDKVVRDGDTVTFTILVNNTGDVDVSKVTVGAPLTGSCAKLIGSLLEGASTSYQCTTSALTAAFTNLASVTGTPPAGPDVTASDTVAVTVITPTPRPPVV